MTDSPKPAVELLDPIVNNPNSALDDLTNSLEELMSLYGMVYDRIIEQIVPAAPVNRELAHEITGIWNVIGLGNAALASAIRLAYTIGEALPPPADAGAAS